MAREMKLRENVVLRGEDGEAEDGRGCSPIMQFSSFTWHRNGNGGLPVSSLGRPLSESTHIEEVQSKIVDLRITISYIMLVTFSYLVI